MTGTNASNITANALDNTLRGNAADSHEIAVATAHTECGYDYQQRILLEVLYEFEREFLVDNVDVIAAFAGTDR